MATKKKSPEEITKANLAKALNKIKVQVADREELWLQFFGWAMDMVEESSIPYESKIAESSRLADVMLREYESRWGEAGTAR